MAVDRSVLYRGLADGAFWPDFPESAKAFINEPTSPLAVVSPKARPDLTRNCRRFALFMVASLNSRISDILVAYFPNALVVVG
jgi:hypothetical protein